MGLTIIVWETGREFPRSKTNSPIIPYLSKVSSPVALNRRNYHPNLPSPACCGDDIIKLYAIKYCK